MPARTGQISAITTDIPAPSFCCGSGGDKRVDLECGGDGRDEQEIVGWIAFNDLPTFIEARIISNDRGRWGGDEGQFVEPPADSRKKLLHDPATIWKVSVHSCNSGLRSAWLRRSGKNIGSLFPSFWESSRHSKEQ
jgi:hypothetical protein